ncbi:bifunctional aspartate transaminase/aspartate 4-decarboxylase [Candidatus Woesearchaeota archaeon]|nr:bifunctional aspartate transaminase/aspartate 4-decarboxylase [Candidatus Woesearchaeota archaeon]MBW3005323.1 bifunctional aspartate transaminase/aspartate 4-decarboxylase [Candidatus Woesearchaeota archaeon]
MKLDKKMREYLQMSPFEIKNVFIKMAEASSKRNKIKFLNAGRGNPNFLNTTAREGFSHLNMFAAQEAGKKISKKDLGLRPEKKGIANKLKKYLGNQKGEGALFLKKSIAFAEKKFKLNPDNFVDELTDAIRGDFYPSPPRVFPNMAKIMNEYLTEILCADKKHPAKNFDLFATEGATAAMVYVFKSLKENRILKKKDSIAIMTPIFSPYLEIPSLADYNLVEVYVKGDEDKGWQVPDSEMEKLKNKKIKAFFMVHPTNPTSIKLKKETLKKIAKIIKKRKDLIVLTDTVYATFVDKFNSFLEMVPRNTICVYSYSKFFGVTGWRLGVIMLSKDNVIDKLLAKLPAKDKAVLRKRYQMTSTNPDKIKFIDRLEMDSRDVALAHTGGISGPQQTIMTLFSLFYLMDKKRKYKKSIQSILKTRVKYLYKNLKIPLPKGGEHTYYYALIDLARAAEKKYGKAFAEHLQKNHVIDQFLFKLAKEKATVCLPGEGFAGPKWSLRVSVANLDDKDYIKVGKNISFILKEYFDKWKKK